MINITLKGNPLSTQTLYWHRGNIRIMKSKAKALKKSYTEQAIEQYKGKTLKEEIYLEIKLYFGDRRKRDWDNYHKLSMDALEGIVYENDNQIKKALVEVFYDKENPRIEILIKQLEGE